MRLARLLLLTLLLTASILGANDEIEAAPHFYSTRKVEDRFTRMKADFEAGLIPLDRTSERAFVESLLLALDVPASSQMLVFSTTSLQLSLISPSNPRALYFSEDLYVGYVPRGKIEIVSLDPELGGIFYIFDIPKDDRPLKIERSDRCMNCHAGADTGRIPGLVIESVVPGPGGGSLDAFRREITGHGIPLEDRLGGWYLTGADGITNHWGNLIGRLAEGELLTKSIVPGELFDWERYPVKSSDLLPQLLHEHQAGFVNRVIKASYRARTILHESKGALSSEQEKELDEHAGEIVRYVLFTDEVALPGRLEGESKFIEDFQRNRRVVDGMSLKDFDLQNRLFKYRCSYMIYSPAFGALPKELKGRIYGRMGQALEGKNLISKHIPHGEKEAIRRILRGTLDDLPEGW